jgi:hypothetical protein
MLRHMSTAAPPTRSRPSSPAPVNAREQSNTPQSATRPPVRQRHARFDDIFD